MNDSDLYLCSKSDDLSSISSLSESETAYFQQSTSTWLSHSRAKNREFSDVDSDAEFSIVTNDALRLHRESMNDDSQNTLYSMDDSCAASNSSALSFKVIQAYDEVDEDVVYPMPDMVTISSRCIGTLMHCINDIATVLSDEKADAIDVGSFVSTEKEVIGPIITLFGPVSRCLYAIRVEGSFDTRSIAVGQPIYLVDGTAQPIDEDLYITSLKTATDASYINDQELPFDVKPDFSDDEEERKWKGKTK